MEERIAKDETEFIIFSYSKDKYCVVVIKNDDIVPQFPFETVEDARKWINSYHELSKN